TTASRNRLDQEIALFEAHVNNFNNPHADTKYDLNLGNINDWGMATNAEHVTASKPDSYTNPAGALTSIQANLNTPLQTHIANFNNPHGTKAIHVNAYD